MRSYASWLSWTLMHSSGRPGLIRPGGPPGVRSRCPGLWGRPWWSGRHRVPGGDRRPGR